MKHRPVPAGFIRGRYAPSLYLDFAEGFGTGQGSLITGSAGTGGTATTSDGILITDQQFTIPTHLFDFSQTEGTVFIEAKPTSSSAAFSRAVSLYTTNSNNEIYAGVASGAVISFCFAGAAQQTNYNVTTWGLVTRKIAFSYATNDFDLAYSGIPATRDTSVTLPAMATLGVGNLAGSAQFPGYIRRIAYWPKKFTSDVLQNLTA